jgi:hypothetical protein
MIATELPYQLVRADQGGLALVAAPGSAQAGTAPNNTWFYDGSDVNTTIGDTPASFYTATPPATNANTYAAARSLLTGFTCGRSGCHTYSVFGNIVWGQTYSRATLGGTTNMFMTSGHSTAPGAERDISGENGCGPCHSGNPAGGYRLAAVGATDPQTGLSINNADAYGCDQCHDAVGQATNSTAFPHGNRNIMIYQWANGTSGNAAYRDPTTINASQGNLWMYAANMASTSGTIGTLVDPSVTLIQGAVGPNAVGDPGNIFDGVCLKCHVPADAQTAQKYKSVASSDLTLPNQLLIGAGHHGSPAVATPGSNGGNPQQWIGANLADINPYSGAFSGSSAQFDSSVVGGSNGNHLLYLWR